jgi:hypothetical protein
LGGSDLAVAENQFIAALHMHRSAVEQGHERVETMIPVINGLRAAAWSYVDACLQRSNWGNPLGNLEEEGEEDDGDLDEDLEANGEAIAIKFTSVVHIRDAEQLMAFAEQQGAVFDGDTPEDSARAAIVSLCARGPWNPYQASGVDVVTYQWAVT